MQGIVKSYNLGIGGGIIVSDTDFKEYPLAPQALAGSIFRFLRPGQRVVFDLTNDDLAHNIRLGSEQDMATPDQIVDHG